MHESARTELDGLVSQFDWHEVVSSTNAVALEQARGGAASPTLVAADAQTAGRGRRDRVWHAPAGTSVLCSLMIRPSLPKAFWPRFSLVAGLALDEVARQHLPADRVGLKWPNDLQVDGVKMAGILLESSADVLVIGMGLNVDWRGVDRPDGIVATSLAESTGSDIDRDQTLVDVTRALLTWIERAQKDPDGVVHAYIPRCSTIGGEVTAHGVSGQDSPVEGTAVGLTPDGQLRIRQPDGNEATVATGDVEHLR